ncbi:hypothetical protein JKP88DRAFT_351513 [Tribonema minus]|uniref:HP domain-containing protein n=1 Tax=Tribonema minus TaxID=303371 RepID=A0A835YKR1_9STRA|nr:hypothetical protein JKP88DRAFT_351513 [Tribonema minus]
MVASAPLIQWALTNGCKMTIALLHHASVCGTLRVVQFVFANNRAPLNDMLQDVPVCEAAAARGDLEMLQWARAQGSHWNALTTEAAARKGHLEWLHELGCPCDEYACVYAAEGGRLDILPLLRAQGCSWDERVCTAAIQEGALEVLSWRKQRDAIVVMSGEGDAVMELLDPDHFVHDAGAEAVAEEIEHFMEEESHVGADAAASALFHPHEKDDTLVGKVLSVVTRAKDAVVGVYGQTLEPYMTKFCEEMFSRYGGSIAHLSASDAKALVEGVRGMTVAKLTTQLELMSQQRGRPGGVHGSIAAAVHAEHAAAAAAAAAAAVGSAPRPSIVPVAAAARSPVRRAAAASISAAAAVGPPPSTAKKAAAEAARAEMEQRQAERASALLGHPEHAAKPAPATNHVPAAAAAAAKPATAPAEAPKKRGRPPKSATATSQEDAAGEVKRRRAAAAGGASDAEDAVMADAQQEGAAGAGVKRSRAAKIEQARHNTDVENCHEVSEMPIAKATRSGTAAVSKKAKKAVSRLHGDGPVLYRVNGKLLRRLHVSVESLSGESAFILADYASRNVYIWAGRACSAVSRSLARSLGLEIVREEMLEWTGHFFIIEDNEGAGQTGDEGESEFWSILGGEPLPGGMHVLTDAEVEVPLARLYTMAETGYDWELVQEAAQFDSKFLVQYAASALVLECAGGAEPVEVYVWMGPEASTDDRKRARMGAVRRWWGDSDHGALTLIDCGVQVGIQTAPPKVSLFGQRFTQFGAAKAKDEGPLTAASTPPVSPEPAYAASRLSMGGGGGISRKTVSKLNDKKPFLYRVVKKQLQRIPLDASLVRQDDALMLVHESARDVTVWIGQDCSVFAASLAKQVGQEISHDELHEYKDHYACLNQGDDDDEFSGEFRGRFWTALGCPDGKEPSAIPEGEGAATADPLPAKLFCYDQSSDSWTVVAEAPQFDHTVLSAAACEALLIDCDCGELYLHIGDESSEDLRACAKAAADVYRSSLPRELRSSLTIVEPQKGRATEKCVLFNQRWRQFGAKSADEDTDTAMSGHGMLMKWVDDDNSLDIKAWKVVDGGAEGLAFKDVPSDAIGVLKSSDATALLCTLKAGARRVLYLWLGLDVPANCKAFLALQSTSLDPRADQVNTSQGREPPFLLKALHKLGKTAVVTRADTAAAGKRVFALRECSLMPGREAFAITEHHLDFLLSNGPAPDAIHFLVQPPATIAATHVGPEVSADFKSVAAAATLRLSAALGGSSSSSGSGSGDSVDAAKFVMMAGGSAPKAPYGEGSSAQAERPVAHRPTRLFLISHTTRKTGAMFVREMGAGAVFTQRDLAAHESMLLDAGRPIIFLWHGPDTKPAARELGLSVARCYAKAVLSPEVYAQIAPTYALPGKLEARDESAVAAAARLEAIPDSFGEIRVQEVFSGEEPPAFTWPFPDWDASLQRAFDHSKPPPPASPVGAAARATRFRHSTSPSGSPTAAVAAERASPFATTTSAAAAASAERPVPSAATSTGGSDGGGGSSRPASLERRRMPGAPASFTTAAEARAILSARSQLEAPPSPPGGNAQRETDEAEADATAAVPRMGGRKLSSTAAIASRSASPAISRNVFLEDLLDTGAPPAPTVMQGENPLARMRRGSATPPPPDAAGGGTAAMEGGGAVARALRHSRSPVAAREATNDGYGGGAAASAAAGSLSAAAGAGAESPTRYLRQSAPPSSPAPADDPPLPPAAAAPAKGSGGSGGGVAALYTKNLGGSSAAAAAAAAATPEPPSKSPANTAARDIGKGIAYDQYGEPILGGRAGAAAAAKASEPPRPPSNPLTKPGGNAQAVPPGHRSQSSMEHAPKPPAIQTARPLSMRSSSSSGALAPAAAAAPAPTAVVAAAPKLMYNEFGEPIKAAAGGDGGAVRGKVKAIWTERPAAVAAAAEPPAAAAAAASPEAPSTEAVSVKDMVSKIKPSAAAPKPVAAEPAAAAAAAPAAVPATETVSVKDMIKKMKPAAAAAAAAPVAKPAAAAAEKVSLKPVSRAQEPGTAARQASERVLSAEAAVTLAYDENGEPISKDGVKGGLNALLDKFGGKK